MKTTMLTATLFLFAAIGVNGTPVQQVKNSYTSSSIFSKDLGVIGAFHAHRQQTGIALSWNTVSADAVNFVIQHSYDGIHFVNIGEVAPELSGWNHFKDNAALPGYNHYRIAVVLGDGSIEYSAIEVVRIVRHK